MLYQDLSVVLHRAVHRNFNDAVLSVFKNPVRFPDSLKRVGVRDERFCVDFSLCNESERFVAVASVNSSSFECQILPYISGSGKVWADS